MTNKQIMTIALLCALAAVLAAALLWRKPERNTPPQGAGHAEHRDSHGHDDRHGEAPHAPADDDAIAMTDAQVAAAGIAIEAAGPATIRERLHLPAQVEADAERTVAVAAPARGIVQALRVSAGSAVSRGQPLAVLHSPDVAQWRADEATARQRVALARSVHERERRLYDEKVSARQDLEAAEAALAEARIAADAAHQRLAAAGIQAGNGASTSVLSPLSGVVIDRPAVAGQSLDAGAKLLTVADLSRVWIEVAIPSASLPQVAVGMPVKVSAGTLPGERDGAVSFVGPVLGEATRMATARIVLPNPDGRLKPGMLAAVDLLGEPVHAPVTVDNAAVQTIHERSVVFVRTAAGFVPQPVTLGRTDGKRTQIVGGLAAGARYAAAGSYLLKADLGKAEAGHDD